MWLLRGPALASPSVLPLPKVPELSVESGSVRRAGNSPAAAVVEGRQCFVEGLPGVEGGHSVHVLTTVPRPLPVTGDI